MAERELLNMALNVEPTRRPEGLDANARKIESKDSMWKPAPIIGREMTMGSKVNVNPHRDMQESQDYLSRAPNAPTI